MTSPAKIAIANATGALEDYELRAFTYEVDIDTGVAIATMANPKKLNSLSVNQHWEFFAVLEHAARDDNARALVWTGEGRAFNAGADLGGARTTHIPDHLCDAMRGRNMAPGTDMVLKNLTLAFWDFPKPSVCAVNGLAVGGGANIALANYHDLVICSEEARFKYPFAKLGLTPELGSSLVMPMVAGMARTKAMMFLGEWFSAAAAKEMGLANEVVPAEQLRARALEVAGKLAEQSPDALRLSKRILNHHLRQRLPEVLDAENATIFECVKAHMGGELPEGFGDAPKKQSKL